MAPRRIVKVFWIPALLVIAFVARSRSNTVRHSDNAVLALLSAPYRFHVYRGRLHSCTAVNFKPLLLVWPCSEMMLMFGAAQHFNFLAYDSFC